MPLPCKKRETAGLPSAAAPDSYPRDFPIMRGVRWRPCNLLLLAGDGIGPEVMAEVKKLIAWMNAHGMGTFETEEGLVGGCRL